MFRIWDPLGSEGSASSHAYYVGSKRRWKYSEAESCLQAAHLSGELIGVSGSSGRSGALRKIPSGWEEINLKPRGVATWRPKETEFPQDGNLKCFNFCCFLSRGWETSRSCIPEFALSHSVPSRCVVQCMRRHAGLCDTDTIQNNSSNCTSTPIPSQAIVPLIDLLACAVRACECDVFLEPHSTCTICTSWSEAGDLSQLPFYSLFSRLFWEFEHGPVSRSLSHPQGSFPLEAPAGFLIPAPISLYLSHVAPRALSCLWLALPIIAH